MRFSNSASWRLLRASCARAASWGPLPERGTSAARGTSAVRGSAVRVVISAAAGKPQLLDGPFTEAREMVGGFFLLDITTREEALAIARRCPAVAWGTVEVRECAPCHVL